jgi:tRNA pseudouridine55 synthase
LINGVLVIDKPSGPTSHDVVARVRRAVGTPRVGHTGTLDPLATGVLPLVIGTATRLASLLIAGEKEYIAGIRLGLETATYDAVGRESVPPAPDAIGADDIERALGSFRGAFDQLPPPFSAKKVDGVRAYKLARRQTPVQPAAARVTVHQLVLEEYGNGLAAVRVCASAGFYVRSLAHDLGKKLGCGAHLETLRRVRAGTFRQEDAIALSVVERDSGEALRSIIPIERLLPEIPAVVLSDRDRDRAIHGASVSSESDPGASLTRRRLLDSAGQLVGIAEIRPGGLLHPVIVLV